MYLLKIIKNLIIVLPNYIGDNIMLLPIYKILTDNGFKITVVGNKHIINFLKDKTDNINNYIDIKSIDNIKLFLEEYSLNSTVILLGYFIDWILAIKSIKLLAIGKFELIGYFALITGILIIFHSYHLGRFLTDAVSKIKTKLNNLKVEARKI